MRKKKKDTNHVNLFIEVIMISWRRWHVHMNKEETSDG